MINFVFRFSTEDELKMGGAILELFPKEIKVRPICFFEDLLFCIFIKVCFVAACNHRFFFLLWVSLRVEVKI